MPEIAIIFSSIIVMLVIIGISVNGVVSKVLDFKRSQNMHESGSGSISNTALEDRTDMIEDRLRVLERLATDRGQLLSDEIEALRNDTLRVNEDAPR